MKQSADNRYQKNQGILLLLLCGLLSTPGARLAECAPVDLAAFRAEVTLAH